MIGFVRKTLNQLRGDKRYQYWEEASRFQWMSTDELRAIQLERIKALVRHAAETVPYYQGVMREIGITHQDIKTFDDFARLPILTKDIVRQYGNDLISTAVDKQNLVKNSSGGSTGEPVAFYQSREVWDKMNGTMMLAQSWMGWKPGDMIIQIWGNPKEFGKKSSAMKKIKACVAGSTALNAYQYNQGVLADWTREISKYKKLFLYGYPSVLTDLSSFLLERKINLPGVKGVMSSAEKMHDWQRELFAKAFSCPVYDQYGSREVPCISTECDKGGMHLLTHSSYIEFMPDPQTGSQKIIATSLANPGMPFIRYDIGDCGEPLEGNCSCGRGFPLMKMDIGRIYDSFLSPEGNAIHGTYFVRLLAALKGVKAFQFRQQERERIHLKIVRGKNFDDESQSMVEALEARIRADVTPSFFLDVQYVDDIPKTVGGKHRYTICEVER